MKQIQTRNSLFGMTDLTLADEILDGTEERAARVADELERRAEIAALSACPALVEAICGG